MKMTTFTDIKEQYDSTVASVVQELVEHPDFTSEEIASKQGLPKEELLACYDIIQDDSQLQRIIIEDSKSPRLTILASDLMTQHGDHLSRRLAGKEIYPLILEFHPGPVCQCKCNFCFSNGWEYAELTKPEELVRRERVLEIFDECRQNGVEEIWFSGGKEPFVNPLTPEYIRRANEMGLKTRLYTNGIAMNRDVQESILDCYQIRISVNGAKPSTYSKVHFPQGNRGQINGTYDRVLDNIASLTNLKKSKNKSVKIGISQILQPDNHDEMVAFVNLGRHLKVDSVHFRLEAMGMVRDFTTYEKEVIRTEIAELTQNKDSIELDIRGIAEGEFESRSSQFLPRLRRPTLCRAGLLKRGLSPYGALYHCEFSSHPRFQTDSKHLRLGSVKEETLGDILRRHIFKYPPTCPLCQAHEYGLNITLSRLESDLRYGIPTERQPYYRKPRVAEG